MLHDSLINKGLQLISESYLDVFEKRCRHAGVRVECKTKEGKNYVELIKEIEANGYDLVVMGALGLGAIESSLIGSVCERVVRRVRTDVLVVKDGLPIGGKILAAVDGSPHSFSGLKVALTLGKAFDAKVEAISAYDPYFHRTAFQGIAEILSKEAGQVFRFRDQERLHEEIIDKGLAKVYQGHLDAASEMAEKKGTEIKTTLLAGKPYDRILDYIRKEAPSLLVVGRFGVHKEDGLDIGSTAENLLRLSPCHVLVTGKALTSSGDYLS